MSIPSIPPVSVTSRQGGHILQQSQSLRKPLRFRDEARFRVPRRHGTRWGDDRNSNLRPFFYIQHWWVAKFPRKFSLLEKNYQTEMRETKPVAVPRSYAIAGVVFPAADVIFRNYELASKWGHGTLRVAAEGGKSFGKLYDEQSQNMKEALNVDQPGKPPKHAAGLHRVNCTSSVGSGRNRVPVVSRSQLLTSATTPLSGVALQWGPNADDCPPETMTFQMRVMSIKGLAVMGVRETDTVVRQFLRSGPTYPGGSTSSFQEQQSSFRPRPRATKTQTPLPLSRPSKPSHGTTHDFPQLRVGSTRDWS